MCRWPISSASSGAPASRTVRRENGVRLISVTGDISEDDPARAAEIMQALETEILPRIASERQVDWRLSGLSEQEDGVSRRCPHRR